MLPPDIVNAINQTETEQRGVYTASDDENAALELVYMEWLNQNRRIVLTKSNQGGRWKCQASNGEILNLTEDVYEDQ